MVVVPKLTDIETIYDVRAFDYFYKSVWNYDEFFQTLNILREFLYEKSGVIICPTCNGHGKIQGITPKPNGASVAYKLCPCGGDGNISNGYREFSGAIEKVVEERKMPGVVEDGYIWTLSNSKSFLLSQAEERPYIPSYVLSWEVLCKLSQFWGTTPDGLSKVYKHSFDAVYDLARVYVDQR